MNYLYSVCCSQRITEITPHTVFGTQFHNIRLETIIMQIMRRWHHTIIAVVKCNNGTKIADMI